MTDELDVYTESTVVQCLKEMVSNTWLYDDHFGFDAEKLEKLHHKSITIKTGISNQ